MRVDGREGRDLEAQVSFFDSFLVRLGILGILCYVLFHVS